MAERLVASQHEQQPALALEEHDPAGAAAEGAQNKLRARMSKAHAVVFQRQLPKTQRDRTPLITFADRL